MKASIYISSENIEVIGYSGSGKTITVDEYVTSPLPEETVINGMITDPATVTECLTHLREEHPMLFKNAALIVDGSSILSKRLSVPRLSRRQYEQFVYDEFTETTEQLGALVCGYHMLSDSSLLACAIEKSQLESYTAVFGDAGIELKSVRIGIQSVINMVSQRQNLRDSSCVLNIIDGFTMLMMIFNKGVNVFISRTRLYSEDYEQRISDILANLSGLIQFNKSEKFDDIEFSYYMGLNEADITLMNETNPYPDITLRALSASDSDKLPPEAHFVYLNTLLGDNCIDFVRSRKVLDRLERRKRPKNYTLPALAGLVALLAIPIIYLSYRVHLVESDVAALSEYLNAPDIKAHSAKIDEIVLETNRHLSVVNQLSLKTEKDNEVPPISERLLDLITQTNSDTVSIVHLDFGENTIRVSGLSATETDSAAYVEALAASDLVDSVLYTGYNSSGSEFSFSIDVRLTVKAKEAAQP